MTDELYEIVTPRTRSIVPRSASSLRARLRDACAALRGKPAIRVELSRVSVYFRVYAQDVHGDFDYRRGVHPSSLEQRDALDRQIGAAASAARIAFEDVWRLDLAEFERDDD